MNIPTPTRRAFLQAASAAVACSFIPPNPFTKQPSTEFHFLDTATQSSWSVTDPVTWALENRAEPILAPAAKGLAALTAHDADRIIRLLVRRCRVNLLEIHREQVVVHHWGSQLADLRPFFQENWLARPQVKVILRDRKREVVSTTSGDGFLYGEPLATDFSVNLYLHKWLRRFVREQDDWTAAPGTRSGLGWAGIEEDGIPWAALKSAWRCGDGPLCLNCKMPLLLVNFGLRPIGMLNHLPEFRSLCVACNRVIVDESIARVFSWMSMHLDAEVRPQYVVVWNKRQPLRQKP